MIKWIKKLYYRWKFRKLRAIVRETVNPDIERQFESSQSLYKKFTGRNAVTPESDLDRKLKLDALKLKHPEWFPEK